MTPAEDQARADEDTIAHLRLLVEDEYEGDVYELAEIAADAIERLLAERQAPAPTDDEREALIYTLGGMTPEALAEVLMRIYDHGTQPNALREARAILAEFPGVGQTPSNVSDRPNANISPPEMSVSQGPTLPTREALADAWDEGYDRGESYGRMPSMYGPGENPYRAALLSPEASNHTNGGDER